MRAYLINPHTQTVTEVDQNSQDDLCKLIDCRALMAIPIPANDTIYANDSNACEASFRYRGNSTPIWGRGVVVGSDDEGNDDVPAHSLKSLINRIDWIGLPVIEFYGLGK